MKPSIGRIVQFQTAGSADGKHPSEPVAALITGIPEDIPDVGPNIGEGDYTPWVHLCVYYPNGLSFKMHVPYSTEARPGSWNWPPRV